MILDKETMIGNLLNTFYLENILITPLLISGQDLCSAIRQIILMTYKKLKRKSPDQIITNIQSIL